jgi:protease IV
MTFLKSFLGTLLGLLVFSVVGLILLFVVIGSFTAEKEVKVKPATVLHLKLDKIIAERNYLDDFADLPLPGSQPATYGVIDILLTLEKAATDDNIKGVYLDAPFLMAGSAQADEIRQALLRFRESGKFVIAYGEFFTEISYFLASAADKVYLHPEGEMELNGLSAEITFFKGMLDKLEIKPQIFRVGDFKSAVEPFMVKKMSEENREQITSLLQSVNNHLLADIGVSRDIPFERMLEISRKMLVRSSADAKDLGLIDATLYYDQVEDEIRTHLEIEKDKKINFIGFESYSKTVTPKVLSKNEIAVIVASGEIMSGKGDEGIIGSEKFAAEIRKARLNNKVKAIVLRINSPGGSALASDVMWREIQLASEVKPVIASMSAVAASGGYYMAMACDTIVASPTTITGSIGIFGMLFDFGGFLENKIGITHDVATTGDFSNILTVTRSLTDAEKAIIQKMVERGYHTFTSKAAEGRNMPLEELLKVASGRVWTGVEAQERGLVDVLGGFNKAVAIAAEKANISDDYRLKFYPYQQPFIDKLLNKSSTENARIKAIEAELGTMGIQYRHLKSLQQMQGVQARMPFDVHLR